MSGVLLFQTAMGKRFYEATMPKIADQLARLNTNLEALVAELRTANRSAAASPSAPVAPANPTPGDEPR